MLGIDFNGNKAKFIGSKLVRRFSSNVFLNINFKSVLIAFHKIDKKEIIKLNISIKYFESFIYIYII